MLLCSILRDLDDVASVGEYWIVIVSVIPGAIIKDCTLFAIVKSLTGILRVKSRSKPEDELLVIARSRSLVSPDLTNPNSNFELL